MALVKTIARTIKERFTIHQTVDCGASIFTGNDGRRILQLDTFGTSGRQITGKMSQSLQFDEQSAKDLLNLIREAFPDMERN